MRFPLSLFLFIAVLQHVCGANQRGQNLVEFQDRLKTNGAVTFEAWNGKPECFDCDTHLVFLPDGRVHMLESGYAATVYHGKYRIDDDGKIAARFEGFRGLWPEMLLNRDSRSLILKPSDPSVGFIMGGRGAAVLGGKIPYWPFRLLTGKNEKTILKIIKERG